ncbi:hypothetical protein O1611_g108 [Lasiodiplodia mahajangana]|uniref:Uncharacterized protein n=1 Tax=Lasiodiplodia mahajangana TaxID=1108764 RepID=A0ACC2K168_9PEZI|nr:hypothetical protein O1611_g108 [Lasiodiplodia mahajangana]
MSLANFASLTPAQQEQILNSPALRPPPGVQPDFDHPPNLNHIVYPTVILGLLLSTIFILLRIYGRWYCMKTVKVQDGLGIIAFLLLVVELAVYFQQLQLSNAGGLLVHQWNLRVRDLRPFLIRSIILIHLYAGMMVFLKTAILLDWLQTFSLPGKRGVFYWVCILTITINVVYWVIGIIIVDTQCIPFESLYDKTVPGRCLSNPKILDVFSNAWGLAADIIILALPQGVIWKLRMSTMKRLGVSVVFAFGLLACLAAGARLGSTISYMHSDDVTYSYSSVALWTVAEVTCGFIVFSVTGLSKSFASFKNSKLMSRLRARYNPTTGVPGENGSNQSQRKLIRPTSSQGDEHSEVDPHPFEPMELSNPREAPRTVVILRARV